LFVDSGDSSGFALHYESVLPVSSGSRPPTALTEGTALRASTVSSTMANPVDSDSSTSPSGDAQDHIDSLLRSLPSDLSDEQRNCAGAFIRSHANVFSRSEYDIGRTSIIPQCTDTGDNSPHFEQMRHHPMVQLPVIDEHVQNMLEHDVTEPAASPWCSSVVMVHKQDDTMRMRRLSQAEWSDN